MKNYWSKIKKIPKRLDREIETVKYKNGRYAGKLDILNVDESLTYIEEHKTSFYRYGDGEIAIMMGEGIPFQQADRQLAERLVSLLDVDEPGVKAAIPYYYFYPEKGLIDFVESFAYAMKSQRRFLLQHCRKGITYLDTSISQIYQSYETYDFDRYFERVRGLFRGRKTAIICGEGIFRNIQYNLLEACSSITYIEAPSKNAYSEYDTILRKAMEIPREVLVCIVLGPTAKPLAYDLHRQGYQAWDIGHFLKDYDAYCRKTTRDADSIARFYSPD